MSSEIAIDARWMVGGIGTYTRHLLEGLSSNGNGFEVHAITRDQHAEAVRKLCPRVTIVNVSVYTMREQFAIPRAAKGCDLLHVPHYNAPLLHRGPMLVSILDLIHITDPVYRKSAKAWVYARPILNLVARRAKHIVTLSEYSKSQIVQYLGVAPSKVTAIHCGVSPEFASFAREEAMAEISKALGIQGPYILYVGSIKPHKNLSLLVQAFAFLRKHRGIPHQLLIVGDDARWKRPLIEECVALKINKATSFIPRIAQDLLPKAYAAADLLAMPSKIEGFGLPVLEAMACGTPVVCSRAASLPEVGGDAVEYFDPNSVEDIAAAIERVLSSSPRQAELRQRGLERARGFTWEESTRKHVEVYNRVLGMN